MSHGHKGHGRRRHWGYSNVNDLNPDGERVTRPEMIARARPPKQGKKRGGK